MRLSRSAPRLMKIYALAFGLVLVQVAYWKEIRGAELASHPNNPRYWSEVMRSRRGRILARDRSELARSEPVADGSSRQYRRVYPKGAAFAPITGYHSLRYGASGVEATLGGYLVGKPVRTEPRDLSELLLALASPPARVGDDVTLTIEPAVQEAAWRGLAGRAGGVAALRVADGAILALASAPSYDPNRLEDDWQKLSNDPGHPLLARAYQGRLPPGSVFKVVTAMAALEAGVVTPETEFVCEGTKTYPHSTVKCFRLSGHGRLTLSDGIAKSCNIVLAETALRLGAERFETTVGLTGLGTPPAIFRPGVDSLGQVAGGSFPRGDRLTPQMLAACGYGQGELLVTPLYIAGVGQIIGHGGERCEPYLIERINSPSGGGNVGSQAAPGRYVVSARTAQQVLTMMRRVMEPGGTGSHLGIGGTQVAGKTGSAQNPRGPAHSWFLALAPAEAPQVAVAVVIEHGGAGGAAAGPVAMDVLRVALQRAQ